MFISHVLDTKGRKVATVLPSDTVKHAVQKLADLRIGAVVVEDQWQKLVGIFSERDLVGLLARQADRALTRQIGEVMTHPVITCQSSERIDTALAVMTREKIRHLPVVDHGTLVGIVSIGDLVKHRLDEKEYEAGVLLDISRMRG
jgi:CBS domain-containing protein